MQGAKGSFSGKNYPEELLLEAQVEVGLLNVKDVQRKTSWMAKVTRKSSWKKYQEVLCNSLMHLVVGLWNVKDVERGNSWYKSQVKNSKNTQAAEIVTTMEILMQVFWPWGGWFFLTVVGSRAGPKRKAHWWKPPLRCGTWITLQIVLHWSNKTAETSPTTLFFGKKFLFQWKSPQVERVFCYGG